MFDLILPGTPITLKGGKIDGGVLAATILHGHHVKYRVFWWEGKKRRTAWVEAAEVVAFPEFPAVTVGTPEGS